MVGETTLTGKDVVAWGDITVLERSPRLRTGPVRSPSLDSLLLGDDRPSQAHSARARRGFCSSILKALSFHNDLTPQGQDVLVHLHRAG